MDNTYKEVVEIALDLRQVERDTRKLAEQYDVSFGHIKKAWREVYQSQVNEVKTSLKADTEAAKIRASMYRDEQNERLRQERTVHQQILLLRKQEAEAAKQAAHAAAASSSSNFTLGRGLRIGAGVAGTFGNFQLASAAYALERIAQVTGKANVGIMELGLGFGALATAAAAALIPIGLMVHSLEMNNELAKMSTLMHDGKTGSDEFKTALDGLAISATVLATKFGRDTTEVIRGFKEALSSGIDTKDIAEFSNTAGILATALGTSFQESANLLTSFKDAYKLSVGELKQVNDVLFNLVDVGKVSVQELIGSFGRLIPVAASAGVSIKDTATFVATLTRQGMTASQSITATARALEAIVSPSPKAQKQFDKLGIAFGQSAVAGRDLATVLEEIKAKTGGSLDLISALFPEERAARGIAAAINNIELFKQQQKEMLAIGTAVEASDKSMNTFSQNMGKVWGAVSNGAKILGNDLLNAANNLFFGGGPMSTSVLANIEIGFINIAASMKLVWAMMGKMGSWLENKGIGLWNIVTMKDSGRGNSNDGILDEMKRQLTDDHTGGEAISDAAIQKALQQAEARRDAVRSLYNNDHKTPMGPPDGRDVANLSNVDSASSAASFFSKMLESGEKYYSGLLKEAKKWQKEQDKIQKEIENQDVSVSNRALAIFEKDKRAYETALREKERAHEKFNEKILDLEKKRFHIIDGLQQKIQDSEISSTEDPDRRKRVAERQMREARERLENLAVTGGTSSQVQDATDAFERAASARSGATSDKTRGGKNYRSDISGIEDLINLAMERVKKSVQADEKKYDQNHKLIAPSASRAAQQAIKEGQDKVTTRQEVEADIHVKIDGDMTPEAERKLQSWIEKTIARRLRTQTTDRDTPPSTMSGGRNGDDDE